ncbi:MAG TPA: DNA polymerase III subunit alpha, partial [Stellaceae bacterium]|nr:DNA polymerase III subunit alpha [Stellaceae bacterium]
HKLVARAAKLGMPALALTDHGNLFGALNFHQLARAAGVKPIIGCELYICQKPDHAAPPEGDAYNHLIVLCENETGYRNLVKIVSEASLRGFYYKPRISKAFLAAHSEGLVGLSACLKGEVQEKLVAGQEDEAARVAAEYRDIFGAGAFYLEIQDQGLEQERRLNPALVALAARTGLPLVATNDCHYLEHEDHRMHDVLLCIQTGKRVQDAQRMRFGSDQFYLKSGEEMLQVFSGIEHAVHRTLEVAERCNVELRPVESPFPHFAVPESETLDSYFERVVREGMARREAAIAVRRQAGRTKYPPAAYAERLEREIRVIQAMKYAGYFLIVWDFIRFARERGIPVGPGRGSAAGSLVSYAMGITDLDPLEHELLFERFLNPERVSMPDIDVDFCMLRRGEVIEYVTQKYGRENVSQIITFGTLGAKAAIKDVGRAMDLPYGEVDRLAKLVPNQLNITLDDAMGQSPDLQRLYETDSRVRELLDLARRVEGLCRNAGMHAAGVVIAPRPLTELVPLFKTNRDEIVTQFDMNGLEKIGLLKMDFLGLTTLTLLADAVRLAREVGDPGLSLENLPDDDPATYELFRKGVTGGIFQFESAGMRDILRRYRPERLSDLTALNAIYRPGPIQGGMIDDFIARKHGRRAIAYELPELEPILAETLGVFVYQEQVMQAAHRLAGYSLGEADMLRRAMGKKKPEEMARQREKFIRGAVANGLPAGPVERVFELMAQFAGYGFNKSHAAAYAVIAYQAAYLKAHHPVAFMAALLSHSDSGNLVKYIRECRGMGIAVEPPDINLSAARFTPDGERIRFGLSAIKNL